MTDGTELRPVADENGTVMYRPAADGGLEAAAPEKTDYRESLGSRRWDAAPLENPEVEKTDPRIAFAFIVGLAVITLLVLVVGYGLGIWSLPA